MSSWAGLRVEGVDLNDDATAELLARHASNALWWSACGEVTATVLAESTDTAVAAARALARVVEKVVPGARATLADAADVAS